MPIDPLAVPPGSLSLEAIELLLEGGGGGGIPGGATTQLQYNDAGAFGGIAESTYIPGTALVLSSETLEFVVSTGPTGSNEFEVTPTAIEFLAAESGSTLTFQSDSDVAITSSNGGFIATAAGAITFGGSTVRLSSTGGGVQVAGSGDKAGFYGTSPIAKPTITGAKAGNTALASLLTQLAALGLITDSTT